MTEDELDPVVRQLRAWADDLASRTGPGTPRTAARSGRRIAPWLAGALVAAAIGVVVVVAQGRSGGEAATSTVITVVESTPESVLVPEPDLPTETGVSTTPATAPAESRPPTIVASIPVPDGRSVIATAGTRVWVGASGWSEVVGIDPDTNEVVTSVPWAGTIGLAAGFESLWACSSTDTAKIDPTTSQVVATYPVGCGHGITTGFGSVWIQHGYVLTRLNPQSGTIEATIEVSRGNWGVAAGADSIWVADGLPGPGEITRIDPQTNAIVATIPIPVRSRHMLELNGSLWVTTEPLQFSDDEASRTSLIRIDTATNTVAATFPMFGDSVHLDIAGPYLWVTGWGGTVMVVDTRNDEVVFAERFVPDEIKLGGDSVLVAHGSVWLTEQRPGRVVRVDPGTYGADEQNTATPTTIESPPAPPSTWPSETSPPASLPVAERPPIAFGESVMLGATAQLQAGGFAVNASESRQGDMTAKAIEQHLVAGEIGNVVVIHAGTNGPITQKTYDTMMSYLIDVPQVVFLTVHADRDWIDGNNAIINGLPGRYPNVTVLDWDGLVSSGAIPGMASDGTHLGTLAAKQTYANYIFGLIGRNDLIQRLPAENSATTYVIQVGDLPSTVADTFGISVPDLAAANNWELIWHPAQMVQYDGQLVWQDRTAYVDGDNDWVLGRTIIIPTPAEPLPTLVQ